eukprot:CAMPEP_0174305642 /NCGR_PEP_ID=MMETSP0809-20121228/61529_1 /TAXON_ID=73025 ORGANISM="Eutreptiella gymnastica-like, Strain CCMP1594" /NCGR_SAMPLE_ID=MMETSP0809 /ASSEMBLY_ACC=CAM_ASM_000658 /LENGTH=106 /DNA_ID=CAMNT_0015412147 /DNA_START=1394 /DNA_END=1711 /DNA_ORIENTATION=-
MAEHPSGAANLLGQARHSAAEGGILDHVVDEGEMDGPDHPNADGPEELHWHHHRVHPRRGGAAQRDHGHQPDPRHGKGHAEALEGERLEPASEHRQDRQVADHEEQ